MHENRQNRIRRVEAAAFWPVPLSDQCRPLTGAAFWQVPLPVRTTCFPNAILCLLVKHSIERAPGKLGALHAGGHM